MAMQQAVISPRVALTLLIALWGFAGWLDQPPEDLPVVGVPQSELRSMNLRCVSADPQDKASQRGTARLLVALAPESSVPHDFDPSDAALLRCLVVN
jgi:hypothetical protein